MRNFSGTPVRPEETSDARRTLLLDLLQTGLARVHGRHCVRAALTAAPLAAPVWVAAVGKAANAMALGAYDALGAAIERTLLITRESEDLSAFDRRVAPELWLGSHPLPDERSLAAGARLLAWVEELPQGVTPLFLISGGASSLVEVPAAGATLEDLAALTRLSFTSGMAIGELNARRAALSRIKGGRLAARLDGRTARALFVSDVPHDDPRVIGSGLMGPAPGGDRVERLVVASVDHAVEAVAGHGAQLGLKVQASPERFADGAERLATRFAHTLHLGEARLCVWGGESTVALPPHPGRGGRNQHLALAVARLIAGHNDLLLLAAGTDGSDGVTDDAGALVDAETCARIALAQLDADECLARADSARALAASGDLLHTGPTGTNVGDLVIGLKLSAQDAAALARRRDEAGQRVL
jgi:hydroxypyruvate reductase